MIQASELFSEPNTGCVLWGGYTNRGGYGRLRYKGKLWLAHRLSYTMNVGPIPEGLCVLHRCDVRACVNPLHLWLGTREDNIADMCAKGRARGKSQNGEDNTNARLTIAKVLVIRAAYESGESIRQLADAVGVNYATVWDIVKRKTWNHI